MKLVVISQSLPSAAFVAWAHFVILSSIDLSSRMNVGRVTRERSAPGRNCEMMCESTVYL